MRKSLIVLSVFAFATAGSAACATKGFVRNQVGQVSSKVDSLGQALEQTQERQRESEAKLGQQIGDVDTRAGAAQSAADRAGTAASTADTKAVAANEAASRAMTKVEEVDKAAKRIVYEVVLSEDQGNFKFGGADLPDTAKAKIDEVVNQLMSDPKGAYFEIEGHTDNVGDKVYNERLGLDRADAVKRYLYEQHHIPLHRMNVISYGEDKPAGDNKTRQGRAQNRRVVIRVLA
ncbi:MAG: OmpA family protein [Acidobacteria bacterium]|nr:OmpA family protein [Acidobacteriota bacterium]